ncbi:RICIN domain-containing protein [Actinoplanes sp. NPDC051475]|uniref:RICIN domain-containing protein n=1 Tax=Actinoplanes sp. NPDC051475 TaxID=3157225 RepID=UPI00344D530F
MTRRGRGDDGSMPLATLVIIIAVGLSVLLMTTLTRETVSTRTAQSRATALVAARTALASALASLRAAHDTDGFGVPADLPCSLTPTAQVTGTMGGTGAGYTANIWYLAENPEAHDEDWVRAKGMPCPSQLPERPQYAYVLAVGTSADGQHHRTLIGTYQFKLRDKGNVPGGQIMLYRTSSQDWCLTAPPLSADMALTVETCADNPDGTPVDSQLFGYMFDLSIRHMKATNDEGLCADAGSPEKVGSVLKLQKCGGSPALPRQQWSFDENSNFRGTNDGKTLNGFCWTVQWPDHGIVLNDMSGGLNGNSKRCGLTLTNYQSWNVTPSAGSGAAANPASGQLVNYRQFGKCFDYTGYKTDGSYPGYPIWAFPCKQSPSIPDRSWSQVWNQVWVAPKPEDPPGLIVVTDPAGAKLCLRVPGFNSGRPYAATADKCPSSSDPTRPQYIWRVRGAIAPTFDEKYRIEGTGTYANQCLAPLPGVYSAVQADWIGLVPCTGDWLQKWNATPPVSTSGLTNVTER